MEIHCDFSTTERRIQDDFPWTTNSKFILRGQTQSTCLATTETSTSRTLLVSTSHNCPCQGKPALIVGSCAGSIPEMDSRQWDQIMVGNLRSVYLINRVEIPSLRTVGNTAIVNVGSSPAYDPLGGVSAYAAKAAAFSPSCLPSKTHRISGLILSPVAQLTPRSFAGGGGTRGKVAV